jgi:hypothetical protein
MSLPPAVRDTTEHPPKNAVSAPANRQDKAADVDRKVSALPLPLPFADHDVLPLAAILRRHTGLPPRALSFQQTDRLCLNICPRPLTRESGSTFPRWS